MRCRDCLKYRKSSLLTRPGWCSIDNIPRWPGEECDIDATAGGYVVNSLKMAEGIHKMPAPSVNGKIKKLI
ncbi:MAG: hypothetical protein AB1815_12330 [Bacillota bacterium]